MQQRVSYEFICIRTGPPIAAWHLPVGPVGPPSWWADASNVEVGQTARPINRERVGIEGEKRREASEGQSHNEEEREGRSGMGMALCYGERAVPGYLCRETRVPSYTFAYGARLPTWAEPV